MFSIPAIWEAIQLWQGWKRIGAGLKWLFAHPMAALALVLGVWAMIEHQAAAKWEGAYHKLLTSTQSASKQAATDQAAVNHQPAAASAAIAEKSNAQAPGYYRDARNAFDLHRVRPSVASSPGAADLPGTDHAAPVDDRPIAATDLVCRPKADDDLIGNAAFRAAQMHVDAQALIAAKAAKASE
ncbi:MULTISPECIES: hypothetical protein [unclassified Novosphingobium]|uniref:hypothetical protein n=1 Tax=unclassified Novosphingobium TaxID=2644732 RepID=UPI00086EB8D9|nr:MULTISPECIES: hypothetical protein [unclassified Novosphingobium]MBN9143771.1 hypothetical protein [Novosphingobium sp.]ODU84379.1 MAG: hypothetical protein ABT10_03070 [Novosphingobium sp. SCN 63-17]OJX92919.1 MAG: hypothetical protein BGP00_23670 [Novosphingobium sp. 63-713]